MIRDRKLESNEAQSAAAPAKRMTRETKLGLLVAGTFVVLACGVMIVKSRYKSAPPAEEPQTVAQSASPQPPTPNPTQSAGAPPNAMRNEPTVPPIVKTKPPAELNNSLDLTIPGFGSSQPISIAPPTSIRPVSLDIPIPPDPPELPPIVVPGDPKVQDKDLVIPPPPDFVGPLMPPNKPMKDVFSKDPKTGIKPDPIEVPPPSIDIKPPVEQVKPEVKIPAIRIGGDPKLDAPPAIEPLVIDPPVKNNPFKVIEPLVIDPVVKKGPQVILIDPNPKREAPTAIDAPKKDGDYDEDLHSLKQNETYRSLSKRYYNSEAYAIALQRYNKDRPGQNDYVRIPPIWVLEKKYAADVTGSPARAVNYVPPTAPDPAPRNDPTYTVADNGEMLADIAKKSLGNEDNWKRIWDLNPQINPAKMIPGGTRLRMPQ